MLDEFTLIESKFENNTVLTVYPLGDVHIGSKECDLELLREWIEMVKSDPNGAVVIVGDMLNMGLKNSKSNVYEEVLTPMQQKELCYELLNPIANKIIAGCSGNHEYRANKEVGMNPLYDVFCRMRIEDRYRENACYIKLSVGKRKNSFNNVYGVTLTHGSSKTKDEKWTYGVDGCDVFISGHTHEPLHKPLGKIRMDLRHNSVKTVGYQHVVVIPFQRYGGYTTRSKYMPNHLGQFQRITFDGTSHKAGYVYN